MVRSLVGAVLAAVLGALVGAGCLTVAYLRAPGVDLLFDRPHPQVLTGFYNLERSGDLTFAWTGPRATVLLPGLDRAVPWQCRARLRGARAAGIAQPVVAIDVDGVPATRTVATNDYEDIDIDVPARPGRDDLALTIASEPTFVPGPGDRRELGVQVDRIACAPTAGAPSPPRGALVAATTSAALFGAAFALLGAPLWLSLLAITVLGAAQALAMATGLAPYTTYLGRVPMTALVTSAAAVLLAWTVGWRRQRPFSPATRVVLAYSAAALYLLLLALLHPSKAVVDALFHAHRLEAVRAGHYFFTQPMPDGVAFPYAIALYVVSLPWMAVTRDHVALLRIVVCTAHILTGLLLYAAVVGRWQDRLTGVLAVVLWSLVPQWFVVVGNANLTAAFGQSTATATLLTAAVLALGPRDHVQVAAVFVLASVAFLSHFGTFPLLFVALVLLAIASVWRGDRAERPAARWIAAVAIAAAIVSVVTYYGHFAAVYKSLDRVTGRSTAAAPATPVEEGSAEQTSVARPATSTPPVPARAARAALLTLGAVGWPVAILWMVGAWRLLTGRPRDRLTTTLLAWFVMCAGFVAFTVVTPVEPRFYRYNVEFIGRVVYATWPAVIIVAASGGAWLWRAGPVGRVASALLVAGAAWIGMQSWWGWIG